MEATNVVCVLCDKEVPVSNTIEDCSTGKPICVECNEAEYQLSLTNQS